MSWLWEDKSPIEIADDLFQLAIVAALRQRATVGQVSEAWDAVADFARTLHDAVRQVQIYAVAQAEREAGARAALEGKVRR